jgi:hypothetical protein
MHVCLPSLFAENLYGHSPEMNVNGVKIELKKFEILDSLTTEGWDA